MAARITISSLSVRYSPGAIPALSSLSLDVPGGSCLGIIGPTGAGKTSLLHSVAGILGKHHPDVVADGNIRIGDKVFLGLPREILFPSVGLVLQDPFVQISGVCETVNEEIRFTLENLGITSQSDEAVLSVAADLGIDHLLGRKPTSLSGGETQRVALATILVARPSILLLDEPVTALDAAAQSRLRNILRSLRGTTTVVLTDTQPDFPISVCDQIVTLDHGSVSLSGTPQSLLMEANILGAPGWGHWEKGISSLRRLHVSEPWKVSRIIKAMGLR